MIIPDTVDGLRAVMADHDYVLSDGLAVSLFLALRKRRPLFLEGEAGVGKTEVAKTLASLLGRRLIRLQCYEGLDIASAAYEWNYARQMMQIQSAGQGVLSSADLFTADNLIERPLLEALRDDDGGAPVLLIDELDRADEAFELRAGDEVTFVVRNEGELDHRLEVLSASSSSLGRTERVAPGAQREVTVTFDEPGTYRVICDVDDHLSRGQQAGFEVGPPAATG